MRGRIEGYMNKFASPFCVYTNHIEVFCLTNLILNYADIICRQFILCKIRMIVSCVQDARCNGLIPHPRNAGGVLSWRMCFMDNSTILITGFSGFVARHFVEYLYINCTNVRIVGIDIKEPLYALDMYLPNIDIDFHYVDMTNKDELEDVFKKSLPDYVLHLAAFSSVAYSWKHPSASFMNNSNIFLNLIEIVRDYNAKCKILSVGSSEEYGAVTVEDLPLRENQDLAPLSPYAVARVSQEMLSKIFAETYGLNIILTRSFNHIGPRQDHRFVVPSFIERILAIKRQGNNSGNIETGDLNIIRDFVDVRDVVRAYYMLLKKGKVGQIYNVCSGTPTSLRRIVDLINECLEMNVTTQINQEYVRPQDNPIIVGSPFKIENEIGWYPEIPLKRTIKDMIDSYDSE